MAPPSMREDSWSCSGGLLATLSHDLFGTGDQNVCEQWAKIADLTAPLSKWHEMASFDTLDACEQARDGDAVRTSPIVDSCGATIDHLRGCRQELVRSSRLSASVGHFLECKR
jgi:hypothetical protein